MTEIKDIVNELTGIGTVTSIKYLRVRNCACFTDFVINRRNIMRKILVISVRKLLY